MKVIIDPYRGGNDTGREINSQYEKNILLNISKKLSEKLNKLGINTELIRTNDISLTDEERTSIINEIKDKNDIIIQNRISEDGEFDIIYPLRSSDNLPSSLTKDIEKNGIQVDKYYQRRLPTNTNLDYYSVIRNTSPNESIIIEYTDMLNYDNIIETIANSINKYVTKSNTYTVVKGDTLYQIAKKYNITVDELKKQNNLISNILSIGQKIIIPENDNNNNQTSENDKIKYIVVKGDNLYQIAKKYNVTVDELKKQNNLASNILSIGQKLTIPNQKEEYTIYTVVKGDTLYQIAKQNNTTIDELKKQNNLASNILSIGQKLTIPNQKEEYTIYTVVKGDTLYQIAKQNNTTIDELKKQNNLTSNLLSIGQKLKIPR